MPELVQEDTFQLSAFQSEDPTIDEAVGASSDDCYYGDGFSLTAPSEMIASQYRVEQQGWRFQTCAIDAGATIDVAYCSVRLEEYAGTTNTTIKADDVADSATFSTEANFTGRARTTASGTLVLVDADWTNSGTLVSVITEVIGNVGWASGNDISLLTSAVQHSAGNNSKIRHYDYSAANAPKLHVEWTAAAGGEEKGPVNSSVIIGVLPSANRDLDAIREASVLIGELVSASKSWARSVVASVLIGVLVSATGIKGFVRNAIVFIGNLVSSTRGLDTTRASIVLLGILPVALRNINVSRLASVLIGNLISATGIKGFTRSAVVLIGNLVSSSRSLGAIRLSSVQLGIIITASRVSAFLRKASVYIGNLVSASGVHGVVQAIALTLRLRSLGFTLIERGIANRNSLIFPLTFPLTFHNVYRSLSLHSRSRSLTLPERD